MTTNRFCLLAVCEILPGYWVMFSVAWGKISTSLLFECGRDLQGHPTGQLAAGAFAVFVLGLVSGTTLDEVLDVVIHCLKSRPNHEETLLPLEQARSLADSRLPVAEAIAELGGGWIAEEALAIAVYCSLMAKTFEEGVAYAVNHSGDSDSTGAMAGNLLGALHGLDAIPERWLRPLELREVISEVADDLLDLTEWDIRGGGRRACRKPPQEISASLAGRAHRADGRSGVHVTPASRATGHDRRR